MESTLQVGWATYERLATANLSTLDSVELGLVAIGGLRSEVNNGGFDQYFLNSSGDLAGSAVEWARWKGHPDLADLVEKAMGTVGDPYPAEWQVRQARVLKFGDDVFEGLDRRYLLLEVATSLDELMDSLAESRFWLVLQERILTELRESGRSEFSGFWCDGLWPTSYRLAEAVPAIGGSMHLGRSGHERWEFTLSPGANRAEQALREDSWEPLLPTAGTTGWLAADPDTKSLHIDLSISEPLGEPIEVHPKTGRIRPLKRRLEPGPD